MSHIQKAELEERLAQIPSGTLIIHREGSSPTVAPTLAAQILNEPDSRGRLQIFTLYPGIEVAFLELIANRAFFTHEDFEDVLEVNFCRSGRTGWEMTGKNTLYLGPGDFSVHTMALCAHSEMTLPLGYCEGLTIRVDLAQLRTSPPQLLQELGVTDQLLRDRFCGDRILTTFSSGEKKSAIFDDFFDVPEELRPAYYKLKVQELLLNLSRMPTRSGHELNRYQAEQIDTIKEIHDHLMQHLDRRISIDELSHKFLMNTTTLKSLFKAVYGSSIAAHIKEHRMEKAAQLLLQSKESVAEIARQVGYESQSKFTAAFKEVYGTLPTAFRKRG